MVFLLPGKRDVRSCFGKFESLTSTSEIVHSGFGSFQILNFALLSPFSFLLRTAVRGRTGATVVKKYCI